MSADDASGGPPTTIDSAIRAIANAPPRAPSPSLPVGTVLGGSYELRERLGVGGMATVYRALDRRLGREVAVKVPRIDDRSAAARAQVVRMFEREAEATAQLNHPSIVTLHHVGDHEGTPFLVLELLVGETLAARLGRRKVLPVPEAAALLDGVLAALAYAHDRGFVHRDLTPRNVFITTDDRVKVLDFGVAVGGAATPGTVTRGAGTPGYMAPEHDRADARSDLWAAAVLFVECVTGARPASSDGPPPSASALSDDVPEAVRAVVTRALSIDPARRPTTASEMRAALAPQLTPLPPRRRRRQRRIAVAIAAVVAAASVAAVIVATRPAAHAAPRTIVPRDGRWRGDPPANTPWEVRLQRIDATTFELQNLNRLDGTGMRGRLTLERIADGTTILSGTTADVHTCPTCTNVGFVEYIVLGDRSLYQNRAMYGPSHDAYTQSFPPYRYAWQGPVETAGR